MSTEAHDRDVLRRLAGRIAEIAAEPVHAERAELWRRMNDLEPVRPMVWITEVPWHELAEEPGMALECKDERHHQLEAQMRSEIYQWENFPGDMIVSPFYALAQTVRSSGFGIATKAERIQMSQGSVSSHHYAIQIREEADIEKIKDPVVEIDHERTERNRTSLEDLFGDILPVRVVGESATWFAPWDQLITWWGVQEAMMDLHMRPDMVHAAMDRLVSAHISRIKQVEEQNGLALNTHNCRIGSGGYGYTSDLPPEDCDPEHVRTCDRWGAATAQIFSDVSPEMHMEFALKHEKRWLELYGMTYYGCCEPLHLKMGILKTVGNLRKISMSPWADITHALEEGAGDYVLSIKPNPAILGSIDWHPDQARQALTDELDKCRGCAIEIVMKDISTVGREPRRLREWARIASEVAEEYAN